ncbi:MAG: TraB/GumN family protein [Sphingobium sp.]|nr:TraB/GumN family protein [Sphingobium sp.]
MIKKQQKTGWPHAFVKFGTCLGAAIALTLSGCGSAQDHKTPENKSASKTAPHATSPALWVVKDADTTIYLFGTVHLLKPGMNWFEGDVKNAFDRSDELVLEVVEPDESEMGTIVTRLALNPNGPTITSRLSGKDKEAYLKALADYNLPPASMDYLDPWMVAVTLSITPLAKLGYDQNLGVEKQLSEAATKAKKPISGLETVEQQLGYFDSLPEDAQLHYLNVTVAELPQVEKEFNQLLAHWAAGKPDELAKQMNASLEATPELAKALLYNRNANWTGWIEKRLAKPGTVFLAVGAGHLAGKDSVIDMLGQHKLKVTRVQ